MSRFGADETVRKILADCQTWAIVGLANHPWRPAYGVARFLKRQGKRIVPIHPDVEPVHGEPAFASLRDVPFPIDCVDVFRRSEAAGEFADQAVEIGAKAVWFQLGVVDLAAYERATAAGLDMVMDRCPAVEWPRLGPASGARSSW